MANVVRVLPDGSCMFRSIAVGFFFNCTGYIVDGGSAKGCERSIDDCISNCLTTWMRMLAILSLCVGDGIGADTMFGNMHQVSLMGVVRVCQRLRDDNGQSSLRVYKRIFSKLGAPALPKIFDSERLIKIREKSTMPVKDFVELVKGETFSQYCKRMAYSTSWGSYCELYVLAHNVLKIPIRIITKESEHVTDTNTTSPANYRITLIYSGTDHYDAFLPAIGALPLLAL